MRLSADCIVCMIKRQAENLRDCADENGKAAYLKEVLRIIAEAPEDASAPVVTERLNCLHEEWFGSPFSFRELKRTYNALMMEKEQMIAAEIAASGDPLKAALQYARVGNYIDFGAMGSVSGEKLQSLLTGAKDEMIDEKEFSAFQKELSAGKRLVYCLDNCGEIVLDKLLMKEIRRQYPQMEITALVRGREVLNDVTREDAQEVGLAEVAAVLDNGTGVAGTELSLLSEEAQKVMQEADVVISKGQGNFETLHGCGLNIYYLFLCKCDYFTRRFGLERFQGVFLNERNQKLRKNQS